MIIDSIVFKWGVKSYTISYELGKYRMPEKIPLVREEIKNYDINITRPIFIKNIFNEVGQELHSNLENLILKIGDEWSKKHPVVKANMTKQNMHQQSNAFETLCDIVISYADKMGSTPIKCRISDCWGILYKKKDFLEPHTHRHNIWSWGYYIKTPKDSSPLVFFEGSLMENLISLPCSVPLPVNQQLANFIASPEGDEVTVFAGNYYLFPEKGDLVIFPSWAKHEVPPSVCEEDRIMVAGNIEGKDI